MKNDLALLSVAAAIAAIALTAVAARDLLSAPAAWNPMAAWPTRRCAFLFLAALTAAVISGIAIRRNDCALKYSSTTLEWVYSSAEASKIVHDPEANLPAMRHGLLIDSAAFIPSYVLLIATLCFWVAQRQPQDHWTSWLVTAGWAGLFAGALDYLENAGIYAALGGITTRLAPLTYAACQLKWLIALGAADFALIVAFVRFVCATRGTPQS